MNVTSPPATGMQFYFSGVASPKELSYLKEADVKRILIDPYDYRRLADDIPDHWDVVLDSSAYRSFKQGRQLTLEGWKAAIAGLPLDRFQYLVAPDVVGDPGATIQLWAEATDCSQEKIKALAKAGRLMPTWQWGGSRLQLEFFLDEAPVVGIGGLVPLMQDDAPKDERDRMLRWLTALCEEFPGRFHLFGLRWLKAFNAVKHTAYSADSSFWLAGRKYRQLVFTHEQNGHLLKTKAERVTQEVAEDMLCIQSARNIENHLENLPPMKKPVTAGYSLTKVKPPHQQPDRAEALVAEFLHSLDLTDKDLTGDFYRKIDNPPYIPLTIEKQGTRIMFTHWIKWPSDDDPHADMVIDSDMVFRLYGGKLTLQETAVRGPLGEVRQGEGGDREFATLFAENILASGYAEARKAPGKPKATSFKSTNRVANKAGHEIQRPKPIDINDFVEHKSYPPYFGIELRKTSGNQVEIKDWRMPTPAPWAPATTSNVIGSIGELGKSVAIYEPFGVKPLNLGTFLLRRQATETILIRHIENLLDQTAIAHSPDVTAVISEALNTQEPSPQTIARLEARIGDDLARRVSTIMMWGCVCGFGEGFAEWAKAELEKVYAAYNIATFRQGQSEITVEINGPTKVTIANQFYKVDLDWVTRQLWKVFHRNSFGIEKQKGLLSYPNHEQLVERLFRFPREEGAKSSAPPEASPADVSINSPNFVSDSYGAKICAAGDDILAELRQGEKVTTPQIAEIMRSHFGAAAEGNWTVKDSHEACEVALVKQIQEGVWTVAGNIDVLHSTLIGGGSNHDALRQRLRDLQNKIPTHTGRTLESQQLQQFSTPLELGLLAWLAADLKADDIVLEPSAGTGLLAVGPTLRAKQLILNEISPLRADILRHLFGQQVFELNGEQINNLLPDHLKATVALINPPFSTSPGIDRRNAIATLNHFKSAMRRVEEGGRIVLISAHWFHPDNPHYRPFFETIQKEATLLLSTPLPGEIYSKHGTHMETRISVFDKIPASNPREFKGVFQDFDLDKAFHRVHALPPRQKAVVPAEDVEEERKPEGINLLDLPVELVYSATEFADAEPVKYSARESEPNRELGEGIFESYSPQRIRIKGAQEHPSKLCESAAMSSVMPPIPTYQPLLPPRLVTEGVLSEAQLESVIYAGEAHSHFLNGQFRIDDELNPAHENSTGVTTKQLRRGWFLGDGTGTGKGRQICGIIADNWARGRKKALWISEKATLIEDARRDWMALGGDKNDIIPLNRYPLGTPVGIGSGILFCTYATLRSPAREGKCSRLDQILHWLGPDFDGSVVFDESHSMGGAIKKDTERGRAAGSLQGIAGIKLQNGVPNARVVYSSATGATRVEALAYASRLGLWGTEDIPFESRETFIGEIIDAGVAAMELVSRDMKSLGLYLARTLSYEGIEYDPLVVTLNDGQQEIYNTYAEAFELIHQNVEEALKETGAMKNSQAKSAAYSAFEGAKLRFFNHLIIGLKAPAVIKAIEQDLEEGRSALISLISTNEAIINRRLADVPTDEWNDLTIDITPKEVVIDYIHRCFPIQAFEVYQDGDKIKSRPVIDKDGNRVFDKYAIQKRDELIERLLFLPPIPGALEQILHFFGHDSVSEITGRTTRLLKNPETGAIYVDKRSIHKSNLVETQRFMDGEKRILVFSDAGGTGRSYHADLNAKNQQRRVVYIIEPGWRADKACQALGRAHRTAQASEPIIRIVSCSNIPGEKRFVSTIAKRLFALGALTRGQRQASGENIFSARDDLESPYANAALVGFLHLMARNHFPECGCDEFERLTGLTVVNSDGSINTGEIPMTRFMNRLLALRLDMQDILFNYLDKMIQYNIDAAIESGLYDLGVETLRGKSFRLVSEQTLHVHEETGAETYCLGIEQIEAARYRDGEEMLEDSGVGKGWASMAINQRSGNAALVSKIGETMSPEGEKIIKLRLVRPKKDDYISGAEYDSSHWTPVSDKAEWLQAWNDEIDRAPKEFKERFFLINGLLLPLWQVLTMSKMKGVQVVRLRTDDGDTYLGRKLSTQELQEVAGTLKVKVVELTGDEMVDAVLHGNKSFELPHDIRLKRSRLRGEDRLELVGYISQALSRKLTGYGVMTEIIGSQIRHFIPTGDDAPLVLDDVRQALKGPDITFGQQRERPDYKAKSGTLHPSVVDVLERSKVLGQNLYLPEQLNRELYLAVNEVLANLGGSWQSSQKLHSFPQDIELRGMIREIIDLRTLPPKNPLSFFATPKPVGREAVGLLELKRGLKIWEPSCGDGALLKVLAPYKQELGLIIHASELDPGRARAARELEIAEFVHEGDCLFYGGERPMFVRDKDGMMTTQIVPEGYYDRVLMNPPFSKGGRRLLYIDHIYKALKMLKDGGILVAIVPISVKESQSSMVGRFRTQTECDIFELPDGAFKESGTNVKTAIIKIYK